MSGITKFDRSLLLSASGITKCDRLLLQSSSGITKCDSYYTKHWFYTFLFYRFSVPTNCKSFFGYLFETERNSSLVLENK